MNKSGLEKKDYLPTFVNAESVCENDSCAGVSITSSAPDREQDAEIRPLIENNQYNPEMYSHNCKPVSIRHYPGANGDEKFYRTEFRSIMGAPVTYRYGQSF